MPNTAFSPAILLAVAVGSAVGGVFRYAMTQVIQTRVAFPVGTLSVNVLGCFLIGVLAELALTSSRLSPESRILLISGFCGGFTTFSTFGYETVELLQAGAWPRAALYVALSVTLGIAAVWGGLTAVRGAVGTAT